MDEAKSRSRNYRMGKRLEEVEATRRRIVEAAVELHGTVGPANTTFSAVADTAGVQRSTVYRHFPDEEALFGACTSHWLARHPWPAADDWRHEPDPRARLQDALRTLYRYYADNRQMLANSFRDVDVMPAFVGELMSAQLESAHAVLMEDWPEPARSDPRVAAAVGLAIDFRTWQSLADLGVDADDAAVLVAAMVGSLGG